MTPDFCSPTKNGQRQRLGGLVRSNKKAPSKHSSVRKADEGEDKNNDLSSPVNLSVEYLLLLWLLLLSLLLIFSLLSSLLFFNYYTFSITIGRYSNPKHKTEANHPDQTSFPIWTPPWCNEGNFQSLCWKYRMISFYVVTSWCVKHFKKRFF